MAGHPLETKVRQLLCEFELCDVKSVTFVEVVWDNVRVLRDGETVSLTGTHLGKQPIAL